jgi:hypothetical protein
MHSLMLIAWLAVGVLCGSVLFSVDVQTLVSPIVITDALEYLIVAGRAVTLVSTSGKPAVLCVIQATATQALSSAVVNIYRGATITGSPVSTQTIGMSGTGNRPTTLLAYFVESVNNASQEQYCVSVQFTGNTGTVTVNSAYLETKMLSG